MNVSDLDVLSKDELRRRYTQLTQSLQAQISENEVITKRLQTLQSIKIERNELEKKFLELRNAHTAQQAYVQTLQDNIGKIPQYRATLQRQEKAISRLEGIIKDKTVVRKSDGPSIQEEKDDLDLFVANPKPAVEVAPPRPNEERLRLIALIQENQLLKVKLSAIEKVTVCIGDDALERMKANSCDIAGS